MLLAGDVIEVRQSQRIFAITVVVVVAEDDHCMYVMVFEHLDIYIGGQTLDLCIHRVP